MLAEIDITSRSNLTRRPRMAMAAVLSRAQLGMDAPLVRVEIDLAPGLPRFAIVGLAEAAVKESRDRVRAANVNCKFLMPDGRVRVKLSQADCATGGEGGGIGAAL